VRNPTIKYLRVLENEVDAFNVLCSFPRPAGDLVRVGEGIWGFDVVADDVTPLFGNLREYVQQLRDDNTRLHRRLADLRAQNTLPVPCSEGPATSPLQYVFTSRRWDSDPPATRELIETLQLELRLLQERLCEEKRRLLEEHRRNIEANKKSAVKIVQELRDREPARPKRKPATWATRRKRHP
jgi:hypothetical protein